MNEILTLWQQGHDTYDIAKKTGKKEVDVSLTIFIDRCHRLNLPIVLRDCPEWLGPVVFKDKRDWIVY